MTTRFDGRAVRGRPPVVHRGPDRPAVPSVRQLWLGGPDQAALDRARDVVQANDVGRQLLADEPCARRRLAAWVDWGAVLAASSVVVLAVVIALALTGGFR